MISATLVKQADIDGIWQLISGDIVKCIDKTPTFFTAGDLWTMCRSGAGFLIVVHEGTELLGSAVWRFEERSFVCLTLAGKRADEWISILYERATLTAKCGGASKLMASGRVGLFRKLKKHLAGVKMTRCTVTIEV